MPSLTGLEDAVGCGAIRLCPVCDGYEAIDHDIAVHGPLASAADHAVFIRTFSRRVALVPTDDTDEEETRARLADVGIPIPGVARELSFHGSRCSFLTYAPWRPFDSVSSLPGPPAHPRLPIPPG